MFFTQQKMTVKNDVKAISSLPAHSPAWIGFWLSNYQRLPRKHKNNKCITTSGKPLTDLKQLESSHVPLFGIG